MLSHMVTAYIQYRPTLHVYVLAIHQYLLMFNKSAYSICSNLLGTEQTIRLRGKGLREKYIHDVWGKKCLC